MPIVHSWMKNRRRKVPIAMKSRIDIIFISRSIFLRINGIIALARSETYKARELKTTLS